jgi:hypothetical protein
VLIKYLMEEYEAKVQLMILHRPLVLRAFATKNSQVLEVKLLVEAAIYLVVELTQMEDSVEQTVNSTYPTY